MEIQKIVYRLVFVFILCLFSIDNFSQVTFAPYQSTPVGSWPEVVAIGDVNNDGLNDVVLATSFYFDPVNDYSLFVFLQNTSGNLQSPVKYAYSNYSRVSSISVADLNNDLLNDVVIGYGDSIGVFFQNTAGTFNPVVPYYSGQTVVALKTGDFNNDGLQDIVTAHLYSQIMKVFYQKASGFTTNIYPSSYGCPPPFTEIESGDINSDGLQDITYVTDYSANILYVYTQNNSGLLNNYVTYSISAAPFIALPGIAIGDLNNGGKNDVAGSGYANSPSAKVVLWMQDATTNLLGTPVLLPSYDCPEPIEIADLNCDGKNEIIVLNSGWEKASVYEQNGSGQYLNYSSYSISYASHYSSQGLAVGDINNDGKKDLVIADYSSGLVTLLNTSSTPSITITPSGGSNSVCAGNSITLNASGAANYTWSPATGLNSTTGANVIATPTVTTTYTITSTNGCGKTSSSITVIVHHLPLAYVDPNSTICSGNTLTLASGGGTTYLWNTGSTSSSIIVSPSANTTYSVSVSNGYCSDDTSVTVIVNPLPLATISGNTSICNGQTATLNVSGGGAYVWNNGVTSNSISVSPSASTSYSVTVTSANGCTNTAGANITVTPMPVALVSPNATICSGKTISLNASGGTSYLWSSGQITSSIIVSPLVNTKYSVIAANGNCKDTASTTVIVNPNPIASTSGNITIFQGQSTTLNAGGGGIYSWNTGATTTAIIVTPPATTVYCVTVTNAYNCSEVACATVNIESPCDTAGTFFFPNAFSPNNDGENDFLKIYYTNKSCIETLHLIIYNRWGENIFETTDPDFQWDGKYLGKIPDTKVLAYYLFVRFEDGKQIERKGNITMMR